MLRTRMIMAASVLASLLIGQAAFASEPALRKDPPQKSKALYSAGAVVSFAGAVGLGVVVVDSLTFGSPKPKPTLSHDQSLPLLWGSLGVMGAGTAMVLVGRERDYGVEVPRRSPVVTGIGVGAVMVGAAMLGSGTAFAGTEPQPRGPDPLDTAPGERWNNSLVATLVTFWGAALFGGGYAMILVGSAQAPDKVRVKSASAPSFRLDFPTLSVAPLYTERERSRYGVTQGTEFQLGLLRGAF